MENISVLNNFTELTAEESFDVNGGIFPIVIAGVTITKGAAIAGGIFAAGTALGVGWALSE